MSEESKSSSSSSSLNGDQIVHSTTQPALEAIDYSTNTDNLIVLPAGKVEGKKRKAFVFKEEGDFGRKGKCYDHCSQGGLVDEYLVKVRFGLLLSSICVFRL